MAKSIGSVAKGAASSALVGLTLLAGATNAARAQQNGEKPIAVKVGFFTPTNGDARRAGSDRMLTLEAEYTLTLDDTGGSTLAATTVGVGYIEQDNLRIVPITIAETFRNPANTSGNNYFYGLGLGIYATKLNLEGVSGDTKNLFGGFVSAGLDFSRGFFVEGKYHYISKYDDKFVGGLQITVGTRF